MEVFSKEIMHIIMSNLSKERHIFCSEADFQFALANKIERYLEEKKVEKYNIFHEWCFEVPDKKNPEIFYKMYVDILVVINDKYYPIELKYKTKGNIKKDYKYLTYNDNNEMEYVLKNHVAYNLNCYSYVKDIDRLEQIKKHIRMVDCCYAIMLTNEPIYWIGPKEKSSYRDFVIKEYENKFDTKKYAIPRGKLLRWYNKSGNSISDGEIELDNSYEMDWRDYGTNLDDNRFNIKNNLENVRQFRYIISEIK